MKKVSCNDILSLDNNEQQKVIKQVRQLMEKRYPNFVDWFDNKLIPGIFIGQRNIVFISKGNKIISFANLTKKTREKKITNIYISSYFKHRQFFDVLVDKSLDWLETDKPVVIIPRNDLPMCFDGIYDRKWVLTDKTKNDDYILNRKEFFNVNIKKKVHK